MSISSKLADYDATQELLERLTKKELKQLAKKNGISLQKEDIEGKTYAVRLKEDIIYVLVASEFKEYDFISLLGTRRIHKEEMLNQMNTQQLKQLAKETGVLLKVSTFFGTKKAAKKKDIIKALKVLSTQKVRQYADKIQLIKGTAKKARKRRPTKTPARKTKGITKPVKRKDKKAKKTKKTTAKPRTRIVPKRKQPPTVTLLKPVVTVAPPEEVPQRIAGIEEKVRERIIEREIVRRRVVLSVGDNTLLRALRSAPLTSAKRETDYESQLREWLSEKGIPVKHSKSRRRGRFDLVLGEKDVAVELKKVKTPRAFNRLAGRLYRFKDWYRKVFVVLVDELEDPKKMKEEANRIEAMDPNRIKVVVRKAKKKK